MWQQTDADVAADLHPFSFFLLPSSFFAERKPRAQRRGDAEGVRPADARSRLVAGRRYAAEWTRNK
jgi:hypothetical protein